jgi:uncharacterized protein with HEPN domain
MSKRKDIDILQDIEECINRIDRYIHHVNYDGFSKDPKTQDAVIRNIEIIGEAVKSLSTEIKEKHSNIPWKNIAGTRDRLIHHYFGVNIDVVWDIVEGELPELHRQIKKLIEVGKGNP